MREAHAPDAGDGEGEQGEGAQAGGREARRRRAAPLSMVRRIHARWAVLLLAAASGAGRAASVEVLGYPCEGRQAGREGSHLVFGGSTRLLHSGRNSSLYSSTFTVELFARFDDNRAFQGPGSEVSLIGNMRSGGPTPKQGNAGWTLACSQGVCCLKAYLAQIPQTLQSVCSHNLQGTPIVQGRWFQVTVRYAAGGQDVEGPRGKASIFINGIKHNEAEWGNPGRGAINYPAPYAPFAIGGTADSPISFFEGAMDEVRIWRIPLTDAQILDTSYETAWRSREPDGTCAFLSSSLYDTRRFQRIASVQDLSTLVLYIRDPDSGTSSNQNIRGQPWVNSSTIAYGSEVGYIDKGPLLEVLPTSRGVLADVWPRVNMYASGRADNVTVVVSQSETTVLDMRVRDPNYDDVVAIEQEFQFLEEQDCFGEGVGINEMQQCNPDDNDRRQSGDDVGWMSFAGVRGYDGWHPEGTSVKNSILVEQSLDSDGLLQSLAGNNQTGQCRGNNSAAEDLSVPAAQRVPPFLPPSTDVQSRIHVRLVWTHRLDLDWWMPEQGFEYHVKVRSFQRYNQAANGNGGGVQSTLKLGLHAHFSPEFINRATYPKPRQEDPGGESKPEEYPLYASNAASVNAVKDGDTLAVAIGETLQFTVRVQDRNGNDTTTIKAREDPGLPPGHEIARIRGKSGAYTAGLPSYPARSELSFPNASAASKLGPDMGSSFDDECKSRSGYVTR